MTTPASLQSATTRLLEVGPVQDVAVNSGGNTAVGVDFVGGSLSFLQRQVADHNFCACCGEYAARFAADAVAASGHHGDFTCEVK